MHYLKSTLFCLFFASIFSACDGTLDDDPTPFGILTQGAWKRFSVERSLNSQKPTNEFDNLSGCKRDNLFLFQRDYSFIYDEGSTKCLEADPQERVEYWRYENDITKNAIIFYPDKNNPTDPELLSYSVDKLTKTELTLRNTTTVTYQNENDSTVTDTTNLIIYFKNTK